MLRPFNYGEPVMPKPFNASDESLAAAINAAQLDYDWTGEVAHAVLRHNRRRIAQMLRDIDLGLAEVAEVVAA